MTPALLTNPPNLPLQLPFFPRGKSPENIAALPEQDRHRHPRTQKKAERRQPIVNQPIPHCRPGKMLHPERNLSSQSPQAERANRHPKDADKKPASVNRQPMQALNLLSKARIETSILHIIGLKKCI